MASSDYFDGPSVQNSRDNWGSLIQRHQTYSSGPATHATAARVRAVFYVLDAHGVAVEEPDAKTWMRWFTHSADRHVRRDTLQDGTEVSTDFTGASHEETYAPALWQTSAKADNGTWVSMRTYGTRAAAIEGHADCIRTLHGGRAIRLREEG